jgi:hypothetical protein
MYIGSRNAVGQVFRHVFKYLGAYVYFLALLFLGLNPSNIGRRERTRKKRGH